jgi:hypothetical protein
MEAVHIVLEIGEYGYKTDLRNKKTGKGVVQFSNGIWPVFP